MLDREQLDRSALSFESLKSRKNRVYIEKDHTTVSTEPGAVSSEIEARIHSAAVDILRARQQQRPVVLTFGAHTIKNGLSPVLIELIQEDWITHLATNGAGVIHDWEFAYQGASSENVAENIQTGQFGLWEETGYYINLALNVGAFTGLGYGAAVGTLVLNDGLEIPSLAELRKALEKADSNPLRAAAAADLIWAVERFQLKPGGLSVPHPYKRFGLQAAALGMNVPYTAHPMFGHDIIYTHPMNLGAAVGRTAERDFLSFAHSISRIEGGVYLSLGSAVMSPMIFEKSLSMARNLARQKDRTIQNHRIYVVDLATMDWDWQGGEPSADNPAYYVRSCKTFSRMGGRMTYIQADNRNFLLLLYRALKGA